ncbi:FecCD family ABC transporter permease [Sinanaerobacter chloroacetimidivorans]|uniref:Iron ABC transporter permease n=1 Tax=Sinanaerobacter chloroacetimidivorans TaxID=2818044 RepID=A0A8J7VYZ7_9FIRM|nr:iron ABC transporter permease [Sinanaerobacter chloroacetimidivorans]MBR0597276.1 iron ABC transporter permease [Sinanaerobacter chloroacetimidivorans]
MVRNKRAWLLLIFSALGMVVSMILGICLGANKMNLTTMISAFIAGTDSDPLYRILVYVRLPRVLGAMLAGSSLAVAGVIIQSVLNNPLASPNIIGINTGAGVFVLLTSAFLPAYPFLLPLSAFTGALLAAFLVLAIAMNSGLSPLTLVLTGFAVSSIFGAGINTILILYPDAYIGASNFLVGGLSTLTLGSLACPAVYIVAGLILAVFCMRGLNILSLGADVAKSLGMHVTFCRFLFLSVASLLAGAAVSFAGLIGFVGLIVPHSVKFLIGNDNRFVIPASTFLGGMFVILCDLMARIIFVPYELPVGIMMSFIGGPFFLYLIMKNRRRSYD